MSKTIVYNKQLPKKAQNNEVLGKGRRKKFRNSKYEGDFGVPVSDEEEDDESAERRPLKAIDFSGSDQEVAGSPSKPPVPGRRHTLKKTLSQSLGNLAIAGEASPKKATRRRLSRSASAKVWLRQPKFECDGCGRIYRWKEGLASHKRLYCGKEPRFKCPHCDKRSFQKINLDSHIAACHVNVTV